VRYDTYIHTYIYIYDIRRQRVKERRGYSDLKEEALDRTVWRAGFGSNFGHVVRQTDKLMYLVRLY
jgi:hypothetical protein